MSFTDSGLLTYRVVGANLQLGRQAGVNEF